MTTPDLDLINPHLSERRQTGLLHAVLVLFQGIEAGRVKNQDFIGAKDTISRAVHDAAEAFLNSGARDESRPHLSAWWSQAYNADAFISGQHNIPAALKRAQKARMTEYATFIAAALLPLHELLQAAKPLIVKRDFSEPTEKQIAAAKAREGRAMTCQCCGRDIFAETGVIAHHGYERPGDGWQTESCMGARYLPFEVNRDRLGVLIEALKDMKARLIAHRKATDAEEIAISVTFTNHHAPAVQTSSGYARHPQVTLDFTRATFEAVVDANSGDRATQKLFDSYDALVMKQRKGFDKIKADDLRSQDMRISAVSGQLADCEKRYAGWKQTHEWKDKKWVKIEGSK
jgi:hypothetical protein